ncbi:lytic murein transglycosylase [Salinisphaera sp. P385]|uniref:Lytic murein transglycosylase n=1 Tax=Spectribacter acetivorans TaxID=3075603 RepID=A0ABU3BBT4_9GAMM|nr:lytic murein transglycosylase [Salinisphaera sp. P385]MDT0619724.1 lytic murein transglycosylase [Salinisphaera sp. P385]
MKYPGTVLAALLVAGCAATPSSNAPAQAANPGKSAEAAASDAQATEPARESFRDWLDGFRGEARDRGIGDATLATALDEAEFLPRVIELDQSQPEFTRQIWDYLDTAASDTRVETGRDRLAEHRDDIEAAAEQYGLQPEILVAIWGLESNYGSNFGDTRTVDSLATLAYEGRRRDFARKQLFAALEILDSGDISADRMRGSWAGAMGHTQFIPTSFQAYAMDGDGDGKRDIWGSIPDVMASTAHYLAEAGWDTGDPWGLEVQLPEGFDYASADGRTRQSASGWAADGVRPASGGSLPQLDDAAIITPAGARGPAFLVGPNFRSILRYNNATSYALAVGRLADRIAGAGPLVAEWPRGLAAMSRDQIEEMQGLLNDAGFDAGTPDGVMGPNTRGALRQFQSSIGLIPDGFPTFALLERLRQTVAES